jgi:tRNA(Ser,Leu) C12 N-acetylase TAN1
MDMHDWNVVVTVHEEGFNRARRLLGRFGPVDRTDFFNILVMRVTDHRLLLEELREAAGRDPVSVSSLARVLPVDQTFSFQSPEEFDERARLAVCAWLPTLAGKSFHLRMHRRGFKGKLSSIEEERFLDTYLLDALAMAGPPGRITFSDPDAIIALETIGPRAGLSLWTREELARYPLLHLD